MDDFVDPAVAADGEPAERQYLQRVQEGLQALERMRGRAVQLLQEGSPDAAWLQRMESLVEDLLAMADDQPDLALYYLVNEKVTHPLQYTGLHCLCCALMVALGATWLEWSGHEVRAVASAALSMNLGMGGLQDVLARQPEPPSPAQREVIRAHAERSAQWLEQAGVHEELWLQAVRGHHTVQEAPEGQDLEPGARLAELLRRVDVYAARLSRRRTRPALTAAIAARGALLDGSNRPDAIGSTMLRVLGLYPPGVYVELANGERAVVIERGERAHTPLVVSLRRDDGHALLNLQARDTALGRYAVQRGVHAAQAQVHVAHASVWKARLQLGLPVRPAMASEAAPPDFDPEGAGPESGEPGGFEPDSTRDAA